MTVNAEAGVSGSGAGGARVAVQKFGTFLSGMIMPNIPAFIAWGFITALFIEKGWIPVAGLGDRAGHPQRCGHVGFPTACRSWLAVGARPDLGNIVVRAAVASTPEMRERARDGDVGGGIGDRAWRGPGSAGNPTRGAAGDLSRRSAVRCTSWGVQPAWHGGTG